MLDSHQHMFRGDISANMALPSSYLRLAPKRK